MNARPKAIELTTMLAWNSLKGTVFDLSCNFKTSGSYGFQIIKGTDIMSIFVQYMRRQIIPLDQDSEDSALLLTYSGTPLFQGELNKKIQLVFKPFGFKLSVTALRKMQSTAFDDAHKSQTISDEDLLTFVTAGQNHSLRTHRTHYLKRLSSSEETCPITLTKPSGNSSSPTLPDSASASTAPRDSPPAYESLLAPMHHFAKRGRYEKRVHDALNNSLSISASSKKIAPPLPTKCTFTEHSNALETIRDNLAEEECIPCVGGIASDGVIFDPREYGNARADINITSKKYPWTSNEIETLQDYITNVEPGLCESARSVRFATCRKYILSSSVDIKQYFHPHHLANSDRIKTGVMRAEKLLLNK